MSTLETVIRLHRWQLDERRQQLAELERLEAKLRAEAQRLLHERDEEQRVAAAAPEASAAYANYAAALLDRQRRLEHSIAEVSEQAQRARDALAESFRDVKRFEIAAANRLKRSRAVVARRQQVASDELGVQIYRRREGA
jgi:flagellar export protein FliJ